MDEVAYFAVFFGVASLVALIIEGNDKANDTIDKLRKNKMTLSPLPVQQLSNPDQRSAKVSLSLVEPILVNWVRANILSFTILFKTVVVPVTMVVAVLIGVTYALKDVKPWVNDIVPYLQILLYTFGGALVILMSVIKRLAVSWSKVRKE